MIDSRIRGPIWRAIGTLAVGLLAVGLVWVWRAQGVGNAGLLLQVYGSSLVLCGLGTIWVGWSNSRLARRLRSWARGKQMTTAAGSLTLGAGATAANHLVRPARPNAGETNIMMWVEYIELSIDASREYLERKIDADTQRISSSLQELKDATEKNHEQLQRRMGELSQSLHVQLRETNLDGLGWAALGALLTAIGVALSWAAPPL